MAKKKGDKDPLKDEELNTAPQEGGFATTGSSQQTKNLIFLNIQIYSIYCNEISEFLGNPPELQKGLSTFFRFVIDCTVHW